MPRREAVLEGADHAPHARPKAPYASPHEGAADLRTEAAHKH